MRPRHIIIGCALLVLLFTAYAGWRVWSVRSDLVSAAASAHRLRAALAAGDHPAAEHELRVLRANSQEAADRTDGPLWSVLSAAPWVGDDAVAVRTMSHTVSALARDGVATLVRSSTELDAGAFTPEDGAVPVEAVSGLDSPLGAGSRAFDVALDRLGKVDSGDLVGPIRRPFEDFSRAVRQGAAALHAATKAVRLLPAMVGSQGERRYLLVFQNNAEIRAIGGMPGAVALVEARSGRIRMSRQASALDFPELDRPALPLSAEEQAVFGTQLGTFFQDANFVPHFPRTAELLATRWRQEYGGKLDGVLSVDPVALSYLLEATGPVTVDGVTLTSANAVDELLNRTYLRVMSVAKQDDFFRHVAKKVFDVLASGTGSPQAMVESLARGIEEERLLAHSFHAREQGELAGTRIAGEFPAAAGDDPQVGLYLNDATGSKMSYYLDYAARVTATSCSAGRQQLSGRLTIGSHPPLEVRSLPASITGGGAYGIPAGSQLVAADVFGPVGGTVGRVVLDGKALSPPVHHYRGRPVVSLALLLAPGHELELRWEMSTGPGQTGETHVQVTPGARPGSKSSVAASDCRTG